MILSTPTPRDYSCPAATYRWCEWSTRIDRMDGLGTHFGTGLQDGARLPGLLRYEVDAARAVRRQIWSYLQILRFNLIPTRPSPCKGTGGSMTTTRLHYVPHRLSIPSEPITKNVLTKLARG